MSIIDVMLMLLFITASAHGACPPWTVHNTSSDQCLCGDSLGGIVLCDSETWKFSVLFCYCMTYNEVLNETLVGQCPVRCEVHHRNTYYSHNDMILKTADPQLINNLTCQDFYRTGQLCGKCMEGYGSPVYSYSLKCVQCSKQNLLKYIAIAFGPLTLFYLAIVIFNISVTSGSMVGYILSLQIIAIPATVKRTLIFSSGGFYEVLVNFCAVWNLDVFRSLYTPFCFHPEMTSLQVIALDYLVGVYPLFLIFLTYVAVSLHSQYSLVVNIWRPAYKFLTYFRRKWDIRGSLVQAFATFLVLSYVKILNVSFDLLTPVYLHTKEGKYLEQPYLYNDGEVLYFEREHLPFAILAIIMLTVFNILPVILLLVYPCKCFQKCLNCCGLHSHTLLTFLDAFQGCYRHHPRDCRYFAALFLVMRTLPLFTFVFVRNTFYIAMTSLCFVVLAVTIMFQKPFKQEIHNKANMAASLLLASGYFMFCICIYTNLMETSRLDDNVPDCTAAFIGLFIILCGIALCLKNSLPKKLVAKVKAWCCFLVHVTRSTDTEGASPDTEESLPHRLLHQDEYLPLIN